MEHPGVLSPEEWEELRRERDRYPFSAPLQVLSLLADKASGWRCGRSSHCLVSL